MVIQQVQANEEQIYQYLRHKKIFSYLHNYFYLHEEKKRFFFKPKENPMRGTFLTACLNNGRFLLVKIPSINSEKKTRYEKTLFYRIRKRGGYAVSVRSVSELEDFLIFNRLLDV